MSNTSFLFHSLIFNFSNVSSNGTSKFIVPNVLESSAKFLLFSRFSLCFPFIDGSPASNSLYKLSIVPYFCIRLSAVFSPIPGTPGILSDVSPCNPFTSISCFGSIPYVSSIFSLLYTSVSVFPPFVLGILIITLSVASWNVSLSPESIITSLPCFSPNLESVPNISSASYPSFSIISIFIAFSTSFITGICSASSSGIPFRFALYPSYILCLAVGAFKSNATAIYSGFTSSNNLNKIAKNPYTAFVYFPSFVVSILLPIIP